MDVLIALRFEIQSLTATGISLGRSFGHPVRTTGDPPHHPDGEAYWGIRIMLVPFFKITRTGPPVRVDNEAEPRRQWLRWS